MAKKAPKKSSVAKKKFDVNALKSKIGMNQVTVKDKELEWIPFSEAWYDATGLPGIPKGECTLFRGFSDTGKSTAIYEAIAGAHKTGVFPVIIDTEGNFKFERAREVGMIYTEVYDEETGELINYDGQFIYVNGADLVDMYGNYDYKDNKMKTKQLRVNPVIEDVSHLIKDILKEQMQGDFSHDLLFVWDSIGSIDCFQSETSGSSNSMWNAKALKGEFNAIMHAAIPNSKRENSKYTNTFAAVNKIWLQANAMGPPTVKQSGGDGFLYFARMIFHLGGKTVSGSSKVKATSKGEEYTYATVAKIEVVKNHVTNLTLKGKIASTAHGYWNPDKLDEYKREKKEYIAERLGGDYADFNVVYEDADGNSINHEQL